MISLRLIHAGTAEIKDGRPPSREVSLAPTHQQDCAVEPGGKLTPGGCPKVYTCTRENTPEIYSPAMIRSVSSESLQQNPCRNPGHSLDMPQPTRCTLIFRPPPRPASGFISTPSGSHPATGHKREKIYDTHMEDMYPRCMCIYTYMYTVYIPSKVCICIPTGNSKPTTHFRIEDRTIVVGDE